MVERRGETRFAVAFRLKGATMPDGNLYDGRYELEGDVALAKQDGLDPDDADAMKRWYADKTSGRKRSKKAPDGED